MTGAVVTGRIDALWRYPVKSMRGESLDRALLSERGLLGDRGYAVIDVETGNVASAKHPARFGMLLECEASYVDEPRLGAPLPPVAISLPGGDLLRSDARSVHDRLSELAGRHVRLTSEAPERPRFDVYSAETGEVSNEALALVAPSTFFDAAPVHLLSTASLMRLGEFAPGVAFDVGRFRPNVVIELGGPPGFADTGWVDRRWSLGDTAVVSVFLSAPRCIMTTLAQGSLPRDPTVLQTLARHNRIDIPGLGPNPCIGVYGLVEREGTLRVGDAFAPLAG